MSAARAKQPAPVCSSVAVRNLGLNQLGEGRVHFSLQVMDCRPSSMETRVGVQSAAWRQELRQRPWREYQVPGSPAAFVGMAPPIVSWDLLTDTLTGPSDAGQFVH